MAKIKKLKGGDPVRKALRQVSCPDGSVRRGGSCYKAPKEGGGFSLSGLVPDLSFIGRKKRDEKFLEESEKIELENRKKAADAKYKREGYGESYERDFPGDMSPGGFTGDPGGKKGSRWRSKKKEEIMTGSMKSGGKIKKPKKLTTLKKGGVVKKATVVKKAQKGIKVKPTYKNLRMGVANDRRERGYPTYDGYNASKADSSDYKYGFARGVKGEKEYPGEFNVQKMGRWEGQNAAKEAREKMKSTTPKKKMKNGGKTMMKRADGSTSQRGLWDNIRAAAKKNKAAGKPGKKPTAAMLKQEKKIKSTSKKK